MARREPNPPSFLEPWLGSYLRSELGVWCVAHQHGYTHELCMGKPNSKKEGVYFDPKKETGLSDEGMYWVVYAGGRARLGHAWDDNEPDNYADPEPFSVWLTREARCLVTEHVGQRTLEVWDAISTGRPDKNWEGLRSRAETIVEVARSKELEDSCVADADLALIVLDARISGASPAESVLEDILLRCSGQLRQAESVLATFVRVGAASLGEGLVGVALDARFEKELDDLEDRDRIDDWNAATKVALQDPVAARIWHQNLLMMEDVTVLHTAAARYDQAGLLGECIELCEACLEVDPDSENVRPMLEGRYIAAGRLEDAERLASSYEPRPFENEITGSVQDWINEYGKLCNEFASTSPSGEKIQERGNKLVALERTLNNYWLTSSDPEGAVEDGRYLSAGSGGYVGWLRNERRYDEAVEYVTHQLSDMRLCQLRSRSHGNAFEVFLNNGLGSFVDSHNPEYFQQGLDLVERLEKQVELCNYSGLQYQLACLAALGGQPDRAIEYARKALAMGESYQNLANDSDLEAIHDDPRFIELGKDN